MPNKIHGFELTALFVTVSTPECINAYEKVFLGVFSDPEQLEKAQAEALRYYAKGNPVTAQIKVRINESTLILPLASKE